MSYPPPPPIPPMYTSVDSSALRGATFGQAVQRFFSKYADFSGRASRSEYWWVFLATSLLGVVENFLPQNVGVLIVALVIELAILVPSLAVGTRRLHDIGKSGWWQLLWFAIIVGWIILIIWWATAEKPEGDKYNV